MPAQTPAVGVACLIFNQGKILLSPRLKMPQQNSWQCPGGFMQINETIMVAGQRILEKKLGLSLALQNTDFHSNNIFSTGQHTVTLYLSAVCPTPPIMHDDWQWFELSQLPQPLFLPLQILFSQYPDKLNQLSHIHVY